MVAVAVAGTELLRIADGEQDAALCSASALRCNDTTLSWKFVASSALGAVFF